MQRIKNQIGRTMIEMLAVLAIIGVITVGAIAGLNQAMDKYRISKIHDDILAIDAGIVDLYSWQRRYPEITSVEKKLLCDSQVFPEGCVNNVAKNLYGGEYIVSSQGGSAIIIQVTGLPSNVCEALAGDDVDWGEFLAEGSGNPSCNSSNTFSIKFN